MSTEPPPGGGGGGGIIIGGDSVTVNFANPAVVNAMPALMQTPLRVTLAKPSNEWTDDDRWYVGQAASWAICNVK